MSTRRFFLKMLGMTAAGTAAADQLGYLIRQPHSISFGKYPYVTTVTISDEHDVLQNCTLQSQTGVIKTAWRRTGTGELVTPYRVNGPEDERVTLMIRRPVALPKFDFNESFGLALPKPEGQVVHYDINPEDPDAWEEKVSHTTLGGVVAPEGLILATVNADAFVFDDL